MNDRTEEPTVADTTEHSAHTADTATETTPPLVDGDGDGDGVGVDEDCDDTDPSVYPGAAESCGDGLDQDCDGSATCVFEGQLAVDVVGVAFDPSAEGMIQEMVAVPDDVDGDGIDDLWIRERGSQEMLLFLGPIEAGDEPALRVDEGGSCCGVFLSPLVIAPDLDGDGVRDLIVTWDAVFGSLPPGETPLGEDAYMVFSGAARGATSLQSGWAIPYRDATKARSIRAVTLDGVEYLLAAACYLEQPCELQYVPTPLPADLGERTLEQLATGWFVSDFDVSVIGSLVVAPTLADVDGDGAADVVFADEGSIYWSSAVPVAAVSTATLPRLDPSVLGDEPAEVAAGDVNGDGAADVAVRLEDGEVLVWFGPVTSEDEPDLAVGSREGCVLSDLAVDDLDGDGVDESDRLPRNQLLPTGCARRVRPSGEWVHRPHVRARRHLSRREHEGRSDLTLRRARRRADR